MGGKKWCEYCRINIDYNKKAIQEHEETRLHIQNKDKQIKFDRHKLRKEEKEKRLNHHASDTKAQSKPVGSRGPSAMGITNPPAAPTFTQPRKPKIDEQKLAQIVRNQNEFKANAMSKIHALIAQKTKGQFGALVEFPEENPLLIKDTYYDRPEKPKKPKPPKPAKKEQAEDQSDEDEDSDEESESGSDSEDIQMWKIELCEETGKACFINNITGAKLYEKPKGVMLSQKQQALWQQLQQYAQQNPIKNPEQQVNIGQWQQVPDHQNIFIANAIQQSSSSQNLEQMPDLVRPKTIQQQQMEKIEQKIATGEIKTAGEVVDMMIAAGTENTGESLREKNAKLKKLIENNFQQTAQMNRDIKEEDDEEFKKAKEGFRPRKKVKTAKLTTEQDLY